MKNIVIVDDEKTFLLSLSEGLGMSRKDFNVITADNGEKAIEMLGAMSADLLITDLKMPDVDGFDLLVHVLKYYPELPVIVMTAYYNHDVVERLNSLGFHYHIEKPLEFDNLLGIALYLLGI